mgnify:CR=1 FL=1
MSKIYSSQLELVGHTPLVEVQRVAARRSLRARLLVKLESYNPAGSVKDRTALAMIEAAERDGILRPGSTIVEATSGNTGVGLAFAAAVKGYAVVIVMPETMSVERRRLVAAYGARLELTPGAEGMKGALARAETLRASIDGAVTLGQFVNPANPAVHAATTGEEVWNDTEGGVDVFVAGVGTGGTLTGVGRYLRSKKPEVKLIAVEPDASPVLSGGQPGPHKIQGLGAGFVPDTLDTKIYDEVIRVSNEDAFREGREIGRAEGILTGISSGAALYAAVQLAKRKEAEGKTIVVLLPDSGDRYLSSPLFQD